jgi:hypothetical protein
LTYEKIHLQIIETLLMTFRSMLSDENLKKYILGISLTLSLMVVACNRQSSSTDSLDIPPDQENRAPQNSTEPQRKSFDWEDKRFYKDSCGDLLPANQDTYPISLYPVFIDFSDSNLKTIKTYFCGDAYKVERRQDRGTAIQVGSFVGLENASIFQAFIQEKLEIAAEIGEATVLQNHPDFELRDTLEPEENLNIKLVESAGLNAEQAKILSSLDGKKFPSFDDSNFRVVLPKYIPPGFYLEDFEYFEERYEGAETNDWFDLSYTLTYKNKDNQCFWLHVSTNQGGGQAMYHDSVDATSPDLGTFNLSYTEFDREISSGMVHSGLTYFNEVAHLFTSPDWDNPSSCEWVGVAESVKIVESLTFLSP